MNFIEIILSNENIYSNLTPFFVNDRKQMNIYGFRIRICEPVWLSAIMPSIQRKRKIHATKALHAHESFAQEQNELDGVP